MKGQALVESLFTYILIFFLTFAIIEVARLQSFKALMQVSVNYYAKYLALDEMRLIKENTLNLNEKQPQSIKKLEDEIADLIANDLSLLKTSLFSFGNKTTKLSKHSIRIKIDLLADKTPNSPPGIHIKAQTCLPVLFSSFFNIFLKPKQIQIGHNINDDNGDRNCFGEYSFFRDTPNFWFRVRAASYSPWPASTQIFYNGIAVPIKIPLIDGENRTKVVTQLTEVNFENIE